jgi:hypothetical protein
MIDGRQMIVTTAPHDAPAAKITPTANISPPTTAHAQRNTATPHNAPHANIATYIALACKQRRESFLFLLKLRLSGNYTHRC